MICNDFFFCLEYTFDRQSLDICNFFGTKMVLLNNLSDRDLASEIHQMLLNLFIIHFSLFRLVTH